MTPKSPFEINWPLVIFVFLISNFFINKKSQGRKLSAKKIPSCCSSAWDLTNVTSELILLHLCEVEWRERAKQLAEDYSSPRKLHWVKNLRWLLQRRLNRTTYKVSKKCPALLMGFSGIWLSYLVERKYFICELGYVRTGSSHLMRISLLRILLLRFLKTITIILLMQFYGLFILLVRSLAKNLAFWLMRIFLGPKSRIRQEPTVYLF